MPKYMVAVVEIVEYLVPVESNSEDNAAEIAVAAVTETADRDKWCVAVRERECEGVNAAGQEDELLAFISRSPEAFDPV